MALKVSSTSSTKSVGSTRKSSGVGQTSGVSFSSFLEGAMDVSETSSVATMAGVSGVETILLAQSVGDSVSGEAKRRRAAQYGENILDKLDDVRLGLLSGSIEKEKLIELAQMLRERREEGLDDRLNALLDEIEQRAQIELAKLTRSV